MTTEMKLFEDYNELIENTINEIISSLTEDDMYKLDELYIKQSIEAKEKVWQKEKKEYLDSKTPEEFFNCISDERDLLTLFEQAAIKCDRDIPLALAEVLAKGGKEVEEAILKIAFNKEFHKDLDKIILSSAAISVLGKVQGDFILNALINGLKDCSGEEELIMESITSAIENYGDKAIGTVTAFIKDTENIDYRVEYLVMVLPKLVKNKKSDEIYRLIKSSFLRMENKIVGASALAEYGDGRAIPALRGYLEKNANNLDRETFFEIKKAIELLGGNIEGLTLPNFCR